MPLSAQLRSKTRKYRALVQSTVLITGEITAVANDSGTSSVKVDDSDTKNLVWVKLQGQSERIVQAINTKVAPRDKMPVLLRRLVTGEFVIAEGDPIAGTELYGEAAGSLFVPELIGELLATVWPARNLKPGRVKLSASGGLNLDVEAFYYSGGRFGGGAIDLTSSVPASSGKQKWAVIWYDPASAALGVTTSAEYDLIYPLDEPELGAVALPVSYIRLAGVLMKYGDTAFSASTIIIAAQNWIDAPVSTEAYFPITITDSRTIPTNRQLVVSRVMVDSGGSLMVNGILKVIG